MKRTIVASLALYEEKKIQKLSTFYIPSHKSQPTTETENIPQSDRNMGIILFIVTLEGQKFNISRAFHNNWAKQEF